MRFTWITTTIQPAQSVSQSDSHITWTSHRWIHFKFTPNEMYKWKFNKNTNTNVNRSSVEIKLIHKIAVFVGCHCWSNSVRNENGTTMGRQTFVRFVFYFFILLQLIELHDISRDVSQHCLYTTSTQEKDRQGVTRVNEWNGRTQPFSYFQITYKLEC